MAHALGAGEEGHDLHPVGTFILAAVLKDAPYLMSARTCQKPRILLIPAENVRDAFERDDAFSRSIVLELASCYRGVVREHKDIKLRSAVERLANRLLRYHRDQGATGSVELPYDKRAIASLLGMSPENLSRAFNTLKPYGVEVDGATVRLKDLKALETLAKPNALIDEPEG
jgi:CRP/FNR family transcriptional activator FtrB